MKKILVRVMFTVAMFACLSLLPACEDQVVKPPEPVPPVHPEPTVGVLYITKKFPAYDDQGVKTCYAMIKEKGDVDIWINYLVKKDDNSYSIEDVVKNRSLDKKSFTSLFQVVNVLDENQQAAFSILQKSLEEQ